jgi:hypothetical protein
MVTPRWVTTRCQPIAISDIVDLLVQAITRRDIPAGIYEVGGADVVTYAEMMELYAEAAGLPRRRLIKVPLLTPGLSSHWVGLVTPVPVKLGRELVESLVNEVIVTDRRAAELFSFRPMLLAEAIRRSLMPTPSGGGTTELADADLDHFAPAPTATTSVDPARLFATVTSVGGDKGWYSSRLLWQIRGALDRLVGGPGLRRGRRDATTLSVGDPVDFWRVEAMIPGRYLRLHAEMRMPGEAWVTWELTSPDGTATRITQTAEFRPRGLVGRLYWLGVRPFHHFVFPQLLNAIVTNAETS